MVLSQCVDKTSYGSVFSFTILCSSFLVFFIYWSLINTGYHKFWGIFTCLWYCDAVGWTSESRPLQKKIQDGLMWLLAGWVWDSRGS